MASFSRTDIGRFGARAQSRIACSLRAMPIRPQVSRSWRFPVLQHGTSGSRAVSALSWCSGVAF